MAACFCHRITQVINSYIASPPLGFAPLAVPCMCLLGGALHNQSYFYHYLPIRCMIIYIFIKFSLTNDTQTYESRKYYQVSLFASSKWAVESTQVVFIISHTCGKIFARKYRVIVVGNRYLQFLYFFVFRLPPLKVKCVRDRLHVKLCLSSKQSIYRQI